jgi:membrane protein DedA with SNARE-associated domain
VAPAQLFDPSPPHLLLSHNLAPPVLLLDLSREGRVDGLLQNLVLQYGYLAIFVVIGLESAGLPLPGEAALIAASIYAGATGHLHIAMVVACAALGAIIGDNIGFWAGRRFGKTFLMKYGPLIHVSATRLKVGEYLFRQHGGKIVFYGRFVAFLRIFAAVLAGANNYGWRPFLVYNAAGGLVWAALVGFGAYTFGNAVHNVTGPLGCAGLFVAIAGMALLWRLARQQEKRLHAQMESEAAD